MPKKSIFRQPGAQHFQLVHRSQRDPLVHDPEASQHVLKPFERSNAKKGKSRADLEQSLSFSDLAEESRSGEAVLYGIYYDDTAYDYMQHLRQVGVQEDGVESVLLEAPTTSRSKGKKQNLIPSEALPSTLELPRNYEMQEAIPSSIAGFKPDMDPHLRQALEALEDDAFVDGDVEDDFFQELVGDGERGDEEVEFEFREFDGGDEQQTEEVETQDDTWEARFAKFKSDQNGAPPPESDSDVDDHSEGRDTISGLPKLPVIGGKRRRKGTSDASGYSMSSSSMFRTEALQTLDERFDQMMGKEYNSDQDEGDFLSDDSDEAPQLLTSREDFGDLMDDFLMNYELLGRKMKPKLGGDSGVEKLETLRRAMGQDERVRVCEDNSEDENDGYLMRDEEDRKDRWDCETILTTYSNLENHPRLIRARDDKLVPKIRLDPKNGLPFLVDDDMLKKSLKGRPAADCLSDNEVTQTTIARPRNESKEDRKARKQACKADRQARRIEKKAMKEEFSSEAKHQIKSIVNREKTRMRKL